ncbi:hypothetical protein [Fibrobacter sp.]|nr:hypothetical protein [Fibrobacter sp.]
MEKFDEDFRFQLSNSEIEEKSTRKSSRLNLKNIWNGFARNG